MAARDAFLAHLDPALQSRYAALSDLEERLVDALVEARAAWPELVPSVA